MMFEALKAVSITVKVLLDIILSNMIHGTNTSEERADLKPEDGRMFPQNVLLIHHTLLCLIVVPLPPGKNPFAAKINNNTAWYHHPKDHNLIYNTAHY
jgi:hypothetical protein